jgi:hypothetical protein
MRVATIVLVLMLHAIARAEDDDDGGLLDTAPLGGIPERMQELEREWTDDVGTKDPTPVEPHDPDLADAQEELKIPDADHEEEAPPPPPAGPAEPPPSAKRPVRTGDRPVPPAKDDEARDGARGKPVRRDATAPED